MITILDCTLREGGYLNNWKFGAENIKKTIENLLQAGIEYIEVGYLKEALIYDSNIAIFDNINRIQHLLKPSLKRIHLLFMINYGDFSISSIDKICGIFLGNFGDSSKLVGSSCNLFSSTKKA